MPLTGSRGFVSRANATPASASYCTRYFTRQARADRRQPRDSLPCSTSTRVSLRCHASRDIVFRGGACHGSSSHFRDNRSVSAHGISGALAPIATMGSLLDKNSSQVRKRIENHTFSDEEGEEYEESAFGGFGDYFRRKKIKLQNLDAQLRAASPDAPQIFKGIVAHVSGYTQPPLHM